MISPNVAQPKFNKLRDIPKGSLESVTQRFGNPFCQQGLVLSCAAYLFTRHTSV